MATPPQPVSGGRTDRNQLDLVLVKDVTVSPQHTVRQVGVIPRCLDIVLNLRLVLSGEDLLYTISKKLQQSCDTWIGRWFCFIARYISIL